MAAKHDTVLDFESEDENLSLEDDRKKEDEIVKLVLDTDSTLKDEPKEPRERPRNKMLCPSVMRKYDRGDATCDHSDCRLAHSVESLQLDDCKFGNECYRIIYNAERGYTNKGSKLCRLRHKDESFENYLWRVGYDRYKGINIDDDASSKKFTRSSSCESTDSAERKRSRDVLAEPESERTKKVKQKRFDSPKVRRRPEPKTSNFTIVVPKSQFEKALEMAFQRGIDVIIKIAEEC